MDKKRLSFLSGFCEAKNRRSASPKGAQAISGTKVSLSHSDISYKLFDSVL